MVGICTPPLAWYADPLADAVVRIAHESLEGPEYRCGKHHAIYGEIEAQEKDRQANIDLPENGEEQHMDSEAVPST